MKKSTIISVTKLVYIFVIWRIALEIIMRLAVANLPFTPTFSYYDKTLAPNYSHELSVWSFFDGIHYLRIAESGYVDQGTQAFFPLFPMIISTFKIISVNSLPVILIFNHILTFIALLGLRKLYREKFTKVLPLILLFPTSFFLVTAYSEPLFFAFSAWFFVFLKQKKYLAASIIAGLASATRMVGILLALSLFIDYFAHHKDIVRKHLAKLSSYLAVSSAGLVALMTYMWIRFQDPLMFVHTHSEFGAGRSDEKLVTLPQVFYRYFKMIITVQDRSSILYLRMLAEIFVFSIFLYLLIKAWKKISLAQFTFAAFSLLLPTLSGTFLSMPRIVLVIFPLFYVWSLITSPKAYILSLVFSSILLVYTLSAFTMGLFIA